MPDFWVNYRLTGDGGWSSLFKKTSVIMNIINVIGDSLFIFVFRWGVAGAAAASLISRMTACFILLFRLKIRIWTYLLEENGIK